MWVFLTAAVAQLENSCVRKGAIELASPEDVEKLKTIVTSFINNKKISISQNILLKKLKQ